MEGTFRKRRYSRYNYYSRGRRYKNSDKFVNRTVKQIFVCGIVFLIIIGLKRADTPLTNLIISKITEMLSYTVDINSAYDSVETFVDKTGLFEQGKEDKNDIISVVPTPALTKEDNGVNGERQENTGDPSAVESTGDGKQVESASSTIKEEEDTIISQKIVAPLQGVVTSKLGLRVHPIEKKSRFHYGIDIAGEKGTSFVAALDGQVEEVGNDATNGNYIKLKHEEDISTFYAHCSEISVKKGQNVKQNQVIGKVGDTGAVSGAHLHFEIWKKGIVLDPLQYISLPLSPTIED